MVTTETRDPLARQVEHWSARHASDKGMLARLTRAHEIVRAGDRILWDPDIRSHVVRSCADPAIWYVVNLEVRWCACPDHQQGDAPRGWCKHLLALALVGAVDEVARRAAARTGRRRSVTWAGWHWLKLQRQEVVA